MTLYCILELSEANNRQDHHMMRRGLQTAGLARVPALSSPVA